MNIMKYRTFIIFSALLFIISTVNAQSTIDGGGGFGETESGSVYFSVGQVVYTALDDGADRVIIAGVIQPLLAVKTKLPELPTVMSAYPNPAPDNVYVKIEDEEAEDIYCKLTDMWGRVYYNSKIKDRETLLPISWLPAGMYVIRANYKRPESDKRYHQTITVVKER